jgi:hypothetical protein
MIEMLGGFVAQFNGVAHVEQHSIFKQSGGLKGMALP